MDYQPDSSNGHVNRAQNPDEAEIRMQPALLADELDGDAKNNSGQANGQ